MAKSIMDKRDGCWLCGTFGTDYSPLQTHHCWHGTANRALADKYGLTVKLCENCHRDVHSNRQTDLRLMQAAELAWLKKFEATIPDFIRVFGKNVLDQ